MTYFKEDAEYQIPDEIQREEDQRGKGKQQYGHDGEDREAPEHEGECDCGAVLEDDLVFAEGDVADDGEFADESGHSPNCPANPKNSGGGDGDGDGEGDGGEPEKFVVIDVFDARRFMEFVFSHKTDDRGNPGPAWWPQLKGVTCQNHPHMKSSLHSSCGILVACEGVKSKKVSIMAVLAADAPKLPGWKKEWKIAEHKVFSWPEVEGTFKRLGDKFIVTNVMDCRPLDSWVRKHSPKASLHFPKHVLFTAGFGDAHYVAGVFAEKQDDPAFILNDADSLLVSFTVDGEERDRLALVRRAWFQKNYPEWSVQ